jgi:hypothetical protein
VTGLDVLNVTKDTAVGLMDAIKTPVAMQLTATLEEITINQEEMAVPHKEAEKL